MLGRAQLATLNLEEARQHRASGHSYRQIGRQLGLTAAQLSHIRRLLKREKAANTRLRSQSPGATARDFPVAQSALPAGLRTILVAANYRTLGGLADRMADPSRPGFGTMPGVGPHRVSLITRPLDHYGLLPGADDLPAAIAQIFPDLAGPDAIG